MQQAHCRFIEVPFVTIEQSEIVCGIEFGSTVAHLAGFPAGLVEHRSGSVRLTTGHQNRADGAAGVHDPHSVLPLFRNLQ